MRPNEKFFLSKVEDKTLTVKKDGTVFNNKTGRYVGATGSGGYPKYSMAENGRNSITHHIQIHRLVWIVFNGDIPEDKIINHLDGNKENPKLENLECCTLSENMIHASKNNLLKSQKGALNNQVKIDENVVEYCRKRFHNSLMKPKVIEDKYNVSKSCVNYMLHGKTFKHIGGPIEKQRNNRESIQFIISNSYEECKKELGISRKFWNDINL